LVGPTSLLCKKKTALSFFSPSNSKHNSDLFSPFCSYLTERVFFRLTPPPPVSLDVFLTPGPPFPLSSFPGGPSRVVFYQVAVASRFFCFPGVLFSKFVPPPPEMEPPVLYYSFFVTKLFFFFFFFFPNPHQPMFFLSFSTCFAFPLTLSLPTPQGGLPFPPPLPLNLIVPPAFRFSFGRNPNSLLDIIPDLAHQRIFRLAPILPVPVPKRVLSSFRNKVLGCPLPIPHNPRSFFC